jgi:hypothetical protein
VLRITLSSCAAVLKYGWKAKAFSNVLQRYGAQRSRSSSNSIRRLLSPHFNVQCPVPNCVCDKIRPGVAHCLRIVKRAGTCIPGRKAGTLQES